LRFFEREYLKIYSSHYLSSFLYFCPYYPKIVNLLLCLSFVLMLD